MLILINAKGVVTQFYQVDRDQNPVLLDLHHQGYRILQFDSNLHRFQEWSKEQGWVLVPFHNFS